MVDYRVRAGVETVNEGRRKEGCFAVTIVIPHVLGYESMKWCRAMLSAALVLFGSFDFQQLYLEWHTQSRMLTYWTVEPSWVCVCPQDTTFTSNDHASSAICHFPHCCLELPAADASAARGRSNVVVVAVAVGPALDEGVSSPLQSPIQGDNVGAWWVLPSWTLSLRSLGRGGRDDG